VKTTQCARIAKLEASHYANDVLEELSCNYNISNYAQEVLEETPQSPDDFEIFGLSDQAKLARQPIKTSPRRSS
jgi:hypothetical protein